MFISMFLLSILTIFIGYISSDAYSGYGVSYLSNSIFVIQYNFSHIEPEFLPFYIKLLPLIVSLLGCILTILFFNNFLLLSKTENFYLHFFSNILYKFFYPAGFFNQLYNLFFHQLYNISYTVSTKLIDKGFLEILGPYGLYIYFYNLSFSLHNLSPYVILRTIFLIFIFIYFSISFLPFNASIFFFLSINYTYIFFILIISFIE